MIEGYLCGSDKQLILSPVHTSTLTTWGTWSNRVNRHVHDSVHGGRAGEYNCDREKQQALISIPKLAFPFLLAYILLCN